MRAAVESGLLTVTRDCAVRCADIRGERAVPWSLCSEGCGDRERFLEGLEERRSIIGGTG